MTTTQKQIPFYDLYGESFMRMQPDFVHLEDIQSRSADLGWEIKPHRHANLAQIICAFDSQWQVQLDDEVHNLSGNWVVTLPPGVVHGFHLAPNTKGFVLSINADVIANMEMGEDVSAFNQLVWLPQTIEFRSARQAERYFSYLMMLADEMHISDPGASTTIRLLLKLLFITIARQRQLDSVQSGPSGRENRILLGFRELIDKHYQDHMTIDEYAEKLFVSVSTLSRICRQQLSQTPKRLVHQRLISEARRRLVYTQQTLDEIALTLGFKDTGYFCRFFKQMEGTTAGEFRQQKRK